MAHMATITKEIAKDAKENIRARSQRTGIGRRPPLRLTPYLFLLPALVWYLIFLVYPMYQSLVISFMDWDGLSANISYVGLENYRRLLFEDDTARQAILNNVLWTVGTLLIPSVIGLLLAVALDRQLIGRTFLRAIFYGPGILPLVAVGMIWAWMYNPQFGFINTILREIGLGSVARGWLSTYETALPATFITAIWGGVGFPMVLYLAALQAIPREQYEAAKMDGANGRQLFFRITLPWLREAHVIVFSLAVINSFKTFDLIYSMTYGGPGRITQVLGTWMYFNAFQYYHAGYGAAIAWVIAAITLVVAIPYIRHMSRE
jgi:raffinose/stachyose/melibiose transport system permease protein